MRRLTSLLLTSGTLIIILTALYLSPAQSQTRPRYLNYIETLIKSIVSDSLATVAGGVCQAALDDTSTTLRTYTDSEITVLHILITTETADTATVLRAYADLVAAAAAGDTATTLRAHTLTTASDSTKWRADATLADKIVAKTDTAKVGAQLEIGDSELKHNATTEALEITTPASGTMIDQYPNRSFGSVVGTIYNGSDTVYTSDITEWFARQGQWEIVIGNPANRLQTQVFSITPADTTAAYNTLSANWTGDDIITAEVTPYTYSFNVGTDGRILGYVRNDSLKSTEYLPFGVASFSDSSRAITVTTADSLNHITNVSGNLYAEECSDYMTVQGDSIYIHVTAHYHGTASLSYQGNNGEMWALGISKNWDVITEKSHNYTSNNDTDYMAAHLDYDLTAGDVLLPVIINETDTDDPTVISGYIELHKMYSNY